MYNIRSVSQLVGIPAVTIRAWEMRYGVIVPTRTKGGHRLYSQQDIDDLLWLKKQTDVHGLTISQAAQLLKRSRNFKLPEPEKDKNKPITEEFSIRDELQQQLFELDAGKANQILDRIFNIFSLQFAIHRVIAPFLIEIGIMWEEGKITVAQEHFMSSLIMQRITQYFRLFPVNAAYPKTLVLCPSGEHHQIGSLMFSLFLRRHGIDVVFLGANTPLDGLGELIEEVGIERVVVSISMEEAVASANELIRKLQPAHPQLKFLIGGRRAADQHIDPRYIKIGNYDNEWDEVITHHWQNPKPRTQWNDSIG